LRSIASKLPILHMGSYFIEQSLKIDPYQRQPMNITTKTASDSAEQVIQLMGVRAANIFLTRQLWCSGAVLLTLNQGLSGDLTQDQVIRLATGLGNGLGGSGCLCGGLNAAALALGLFLGHGRLATRDNQVVLDATHKLHTQFKAAFGATCCRVLVNGLRHGSRAHFQRGARHTAKAAELAAELILGHKPELVHQVNWKFLNQKESRLGTHMKVVANRLPKR
jgi:C_GCAxxG_C_C family probable redox protein